MPFSVRRQGSITLGSEDDPKYSLKVLEVGDDGTLTNTTYDREPATLTLTAPAIFGSMAIGGADLEIETTIVLPAEATVGDLKRLRGAFPKGAEGDFPLVDQYIDELDGPYAGARTVDGGLRSGLFREITEGPTTEFDDRPLLEVLEQELGCTQEDIANSLSINFI